MPVYDAGMKKCTVQRQGIGARLTELRIRAGLSQQELAARLNAPLANIGFWERTSTPPSSKVLPRLAEALGTTVEEILTGKAQAAARRGGPVGKARRVFEAVSRLPKRQQQKIVEVVEAFVAQHAVNA